MIYCLFGSDEFSVRARLQALRAEAEKATPGLDYSFVEASKCSLEEIVNLIEAQSLMAARKFLVIQNLLADGAPEVQQWLTQRLTKIDSADPTVIIFIETQPPAKKNLLGQQLAAYPTELYEPLNSTQTKLWLQSQTKLRGLALDPPVANYLLTNFSGDLLRLSNELDKLAAFAAGQKITLMMTQTLAVPLIHDHIFQMIDALAHKKLSLANQLINTQLALGTAEHELLAMVAYQFRNILLVRTLRDQKLSQAQIAARTKLHPFVVRKSWDFSGDFSLSQLQRIFYLLQKVDVAIKQNQTPPRVGLDILAAQIVSC
ncbi:MAG: DNA polymerase III subunit delta [Patescibacteria group bacterium]|jgi:DNA polymerase-3 subunit delta